MDFLTTVEIFFMHTLVTSSKSPLSLSVPRNNLVKLDTAAAEDVQRAANGQVDFAAAQLLHKLQICQVTSTAGVGDRNAADGREKLDKLRVDACLLALDVGGVDEEF